MKIGFSLSLCIKDIAQGKVKIEDVKHIVTGCSVKTETDIHEILCQYSKTYWKDFSMEALDAVNVLRREYKISWLSAYEKNPVMIGQTIWLDWPE